MSRVVSDDYCDNWDRIRWAGALKQAIKSERGQAVLRELETALLSLPEKSLIGGAFSYCGQVCALGALAVKRKVDEGKEGSTARYEVEEEFSDILDDSEMVARRLSIAHTLAWQVMYENDERSCGRTPEQKYAHVLAWVRERIKPVAHKA